MQQPNLINKNKVELTGCYIEITSKCNLRCLHCYNDSGELISQISVETFKNVLNCYDSPEKASITFSGGEPLLHPQFWDLVDMTLEAGIPHSSILVVTNATLINKEVAMKFAKRGIAIQISLNGSKAELHDAICGKGNYERTMQGLRNILENESNMTIVRCLVNKQNIDDLEEISKMLYDLGVMKILFGTLKNGGRAEENLDKLLLPQSEEYEILEIFRESEIVKKIDGEIKGSISVPVTFSGSCPYVIPDNKPVPFNPRIDSKGNVFICQSFFDTMYSVGNINKSRLDEIMLDTPFENLVNYLTTGISYIHACTTCVWKKACYRGCVADCIANGSIQETDGACYSRKKALAKEYIKFINKEVATAVS